MLKCPFAKTDNTMPDARYLDLRRVKSHPGLTAAEREGVPPGLPANLAQSWTALLNGVLTERGLLHHPPTNAIQSGIVSGRRLLAERLLDNVQHSRQPWAVLTSDEVDRFAVAYKKDDVTCQRLMDYLIRVGSKVRERQIAAARKREDEKNKADN